MGNTSIEWTDKTWGPVVGCTRKSPGCEHCYAEELAARNVLMSAALGRRSVYLPVVDAQRRRWNRAIELLPDRLLQPLSFKPGTQVFVCSMSDLFHEGVPFDYIRQVWGVMASTPAVTYQVLTKRPERMVEFLAWLEREGLPVGVGAHTLSTEARRAADDGPLRNAWLGTSVEDQQRADERVPLLLDAPAAVRFLSVEPLLGELNIRPWLQAKFPRGPGLLNGRAYMRSHGSNVVDWVIVGGESGPGARPLDPAWVRSLRDQCAEEVSGRDAGAAFFFKQWGGVRKGKAGRVLDGRTHDAMPGVHHG